MYDVTVIGAGVIGGLTARALTRYRLKVCILESESDVAMGASGANSGIAHAGFDADTGTLKAKYNLLGAGMMPRVCEELGVKYRRNGSLVAAYTEEEEETLRILLARGVANGVQGLSILSREELFATEPNISEAARGALYAETGGIVCPDGLTIAAVGNAMDNGADLFYDSEVTAIRSTADGFLVRSKTGEIETRFIVNAAGLFADRIAGMIGDASFQVHARKGEYILLDKSSGHYVRHTLFGCPTKRGKGILISPTVDGNLIVGPTAEEIDSKEDKATTANGLSDLIRRAGQMVKDLPLQNTITSFAGVRAFSDRHDFVIGASGVNARMIHVAGIESPGLTSAPAIAEEVVRLISLQTELKPNEDFSPYRRADSYFQSLGAAEKNRLIAENGDFGKVICRCEGITRGEIVDAVLRNPPANTTDGVKRRTRAGMGRCQGGFCQPSVAEIIAECRGIPLTDVTKCGKHYYLLEGRTK